MCPPQGLLDVARQIEWSSRESFNDDATNHQTQLTCLDKSGRPNRLAYALIASYGILMYARNFGASHIATEKKGPELRDLYSKWMAGILA